MRLILVAAVLVLSACAPKDGKDGGRGRDGSGCSVQQAMNGAIVICTDGTSALITNGVNGLNGTNGTDGTDGHDGNNGHDGLPGMDGRNGVDAIVEVIDPCGNNPNQFDEVILRLHDGSLLAYFEGHGNDRFLSIIGNGSYRTTDAQQCYFTVTNGVISY